MILDELALTDFGVYRGRQVFTLTPVDETRPIVLIGAQNGGGKTTFMEGLQLAFFGKLGHANLRAGSYDDLLRRAINRQADRTAGASVSVKFHRLVDGRMQRFEITRRWFERDSSLRETFDVRVDGEEDRVLATHWNEQVESMLPPRIAPLFFFDGEKIEQFAQLERSGEILSTAVNVLLGLDIVERLGIDLEVFERRKASDDDAPQAKSLLREAVDATESAEANCAIAREELASRKRELDFRREKAEAAKRKLRAEGGDFYAARNDLRALEQQNDIALENAERALRVWAADTAPLLLVQDLLQEALGQARKEAEGEAARQAIGILGERDATLLKLLKGAGASDVVQRAAQKFLSEDVARLTAKADAERFLDLSPAGHASLEGLVSSGLTIAEDLRSALLEEHDRSQAQRDDIARELAAVPASETIAPYLAAVRAEEALLADAELRWQAALRALEAAERQSAVVRHRYKATLDSQLQSHLLDEDAHRMVLHSMKVRETLQKFRSGVLAHHLGRIENLLLDGLKQLLRKKDLITGVSINPGDFSITLQGKGWDSLPAERLSAGERQLFAVALLWALARASGHTAPTVIDTPLGRLDSIHRLRLVDAYFPAASHQVILLSTDEEITAQHLERLRPHLSRALTIEHDPATGGSVVRKGYNLHPLSDLELV